jgi:hypothetical protein
MFPECFLNVQAQAEEVAYDLRQVRSLFATYDKELFAALHYEIERADNELPGQIKKKGAKPNKGESRKDGDKGGGDKSPKRDKGPPRKILSVPPVVFAKRGGRVASSTLQQK